MIDDLMDEPEYDEANCEDTPEPIMNTKPKPMTVQEAGRLGGKPGVANPRKGHTTEQARAHVNVRWQNRKSMSYKDGIAYAMHRGRVRNTASGKTGNLVEWCRGSGCKVFIGYEWIGAIQMPIFETWMKESTEKESNDTPISQPA